MEITHAKEDPRIAEFSQFRRLFRMDKPRMSFETHAPPDLQAGAYANALAIWHTAHEFTFDFLVSSEPLQPARTEEGEEVIRAPHRLVARIRIPPTAV